MVLRLFVLYVVVLAAALRLKGLRVLIIGATGGTGRQLVTQALERGHAVTALARNPTALAMTHPRLRVLRGDVLDAASLDEAARGQDAVLSALGHKKFFPPNRILSNGTRNVLRAMEAHGVSRFVCETSLGIGDTTGRMGLSYTLFVIPFILPGYFWDKTRQELLIAESRLNWTLVRPGALTNGERRGKYRHGSHLGSFFRTVRISRADVADFMLNQLTEDTYLRAAPGVCW
jgi:putative NADH-flavin reductase